MKREKLFVYVGGNFIIIAKEGFAEHVAKERYLGGPLCVAKMTMPALFTNKEFAETLVMANDLVKVYNSTIP